MRFIKDNFLAIFLSILLIFLFCHASFISKQLVSLLFQDRVSSIPMTDSYTKKGEYAYVKPTSSFTPYSKGDIKRIFYTIVDAGWKDFTFYCPHEYTNCISDMKEFSQDQDLLTHINNYVHPYHSFSNIKTTLSETGEVKIEVSYLYSPEQITLIEQKLDQIIKNEIDSTASLYDQIKAFHDYIIDHTKYDVKRNDEGTSSYLSYLAYGPLIDGYATCNGYTDVMALYLNRLGLKNYKIATTQSEDTKEGHVWNAVFLDDEWLHLDLTWDDPVSKDGKDYLQHKYFLVNNEELEEADHGEVEVLEHRFDPSIYLEFQKNQ